MGKNDSSKTRVVPFMKFLNKDISLINIFLKKCLRTNVELTSNITEYRYGKKSNGDPGEMSIPAKQSLLIWYILHPEKLDRAQNIQRNGSPNISTINAREEFFNGIKARKIEALNAISELNKKDKYGYGKEWYYFEGYTNPDIYIETDSIILIGEAKRTESHLTNEVTWYKKRDQLIRHVDSIFGTERAEGKDVYSFLILDGKNEGTMKDIIYYPEEQIIKDSLPHLIPEEQKQIKETYIGFTTWQAIELIFGFSFSDEK